MGTLENLQKDLHDPPAGRLRDVVNEIAVQGRSVTHILQNLDSLAPDFEAWYAPIQGQMKKDDLLQFFKDLRNDSLKKGEDGVKGAVVGTGVKPWGVEFTSEGAICTITNSDGTKERSFHRKPDNAVSGFIGDGETGGVYGVKGRLPGPIARPPTS